MGFTIAVNKFSLHQRRVKRTRVTAAIRRRETDAVALEEPLEIRVGDSILSVTMRTPGHDFELAAGFLFTEGIVRGHREIARLRYCPEGRDRAAENIVTVSVTGRAPFELARGRRLHMTTSSCGICGKSSIAAVRTGFPPLLGKTRVSGEVLLKLSDQMSAVQETFHATGGLHAAALFDLKGLLLLAREDIGRHNAVDKVIGASLLEGKCPLDRHILMVSGRLSFEIVQKALAARVPVLAGVSAPSSLAVDLARQSRMTLIGFLRGESFNIYSGEKRVTSP